MASSDASQKAVIFDIGRHSIRVGLSTSVESPKLTVPTFVGYPRQRAHVGMSGQERYVGVDLMPYKSLCDVYSPLGEDALERPDDLEALVAQGFSLLGITPEETPVVVTEPANASRGLRNDVGRLFLSRFHVPSIMMVSQGATAVFGAGATSGLIVDVGEHSARSFAVVDGVGLMSTYVQTPIAGRCVTEHVQAALKDTNQAHAVGHAEQVKEAMCFVRNVEEDDNVEDLELLSTKEFTLPDGKPITIGGPRFTAPESLFDAASHRDAVGNVKAPRVPEIARDSLLACDSLARDVVAPSMVLCGGGAMHRNFGLRMEHWFRHRFDLPPALRASVQLLDSPVSPINRTWVGAACLAGLSSANGLYVTQAEVSEEGLGALGKHRLMHE